MKLFGLLDRIRRGFQPVTTETSAASPRWYGPRAETPQRDRLLREHEGAWSNFVDEVGARFFGQAQDTKTIATALEVEEATAYAGLIAFRRRREQKEAAA